MGMKRPLPKTPQGYFFVSLWLLCCATFYFPANSSALHSFPCWSCGHGMENNKDRTKPNPMIENPGTSPRPHIPACLHYDAIRGLMLIYDLD